VEFARGSTHSPDTGAATEPAGGPTIFTAIQKQLGLKLVKVNNVSEDLLVIDHVEKEPTAN
jgi:uncharacterized protein (TIGR03435 family)